MDQVFIHLSVGFLCSAVACYVGINGYSKIAALNWVFAALNFGFAFALSA